MSDTPETDLFEINFPDAPVSGWKRIARRLERERDELRRWKTEALTVMPPYQEIGQEIGVTFGDSIHDKILPELIRRREEIEILRREQATTTIEGDETSMYVIETRTIRLKKYNPKFGDDRKCECGHSYYRHFDWGDEDSGCSCKYCGCNDFLEVDPLVVPD
jgi:uncharacterized protein YacL (UPF0231 family)